jgi:hypothetical protein
MNEPLLPLIVLLSAYWIWQNALRARERARALARELCARGGVQLLDQTVSLRRVRLQRVPGRGLRLLRCYGFEVSVDGDDRRHGSLDLLDDEIVSWDLPMPQEASATGPGNVIELNPTRTVH